MHPAAPPAHLHCVHYHQCWGPGSHPAAPPFWRICRLFHVAPRGPAGGRFSGLWSPRGDIWSGDEGNVGVLSHLSASFLRKP